MNSKILVSVSSCNGPHQQRTVLIIVKFVVAIITTLSSSLNSRYFINFVAEKKRSINQPSVFKSFFLNSISDGLSLFKSGFNLNEYIFTILQNKWFYLGKRCLGHGIKWNNCGTDRRKLMIWGMKKSNIVLLKWPIIPTTANVIPAK